MAENKLDTIVVGGVEYDIGNDLPISKETLSDDNEEIIIGESKDNPSIIIKNDVVKVKKITDLEGNDIGKNINNTLIYKSADINHIFVIGQSLSIGSMGTVASYNNYRNSLMFENGGTITRNPIESNSLGDIVPASNPSSECPILSMSEELYNLMQLENEINDFDLYGFQTLITTYGFGGISLASLSERIDDMKTIIKTAYQKVLSSGKTYAVAAIGWVQGEADRKTNTRGETTYYNRLNALFSQLNAFIKTLTGQEDVQFITYQTSSCSGYSNKDIKPYIPLSLLKITNDFSNYCMGAVTYQSVYQADSAHMNTNSYRLMGANMGTALKRRIIDGIDFSPISVKAKKVYSYGSKFIIELCMNVPCPPLVFDNINPVSGEVQIFKDQESGEIVNIPFYGFEIMNADHITILREDGVYIESNWYSVDIIESVSIKRGNTINIVCNSNPSGLELWYARRGNQGGGYLRDSQGDGVKISSSSESVIRVDNWCPIFMLII